MVTSQPAPQLDRLAFAGRLSTSMAEAGLTRRDLAAQVGAHHNRVGEWVRGARWPSIRHLASLANALNVDIDWLLLGSPGHAPEPGVASGQRAIELAHELAQLAPPLVLIAERAAYIAASTTPLA
ncbi:MAG: helix-turn-helix domain-containing protein [Solirubrobacteraceae bacterium]